MHIHKLTKAISSLIIFCLTAVTLPVQALPTGINFASGSGGSTCGGCHSGGAFSYLASLTPTGGSVVELNTAVTLTFSVSKTGGADAKDTGLNVASPSGGTLTEGSALLQLMAGENGLNEITHVHPQPSNSQTVGLGNVGAGYTWPSFTWTAPNSSGDFILYGCGNLVNGNRDGNLVDANFGETGDNPTCTTLTMTVNNIPVLTATGGSVAHTEQVAVTVDSGLTATDTEGDTISSASITISANYSAASGDSLTLGSCPGGAICSGSGTQTITITGSSAIGNYQTAFRSVTFNTTSDSPTTLTRTVQFSATDALGRSDSATRTVTVATSNDAPVISGVDNIANYAENGAAVTIDSAVTISDVDSSNLNQALVSITGNFSSTEDALVYSTVNGITGSYNSGTGVLTLTHAGTTLAAFEQALESVQYQNSSEDPSTLTRTISFVVRDTTNTSSAADPTTLTITAGNDAPVISAVDNPAAFVENSGAVTIDSAVTISDADSTNLDQALVSITANFSSTEDALVYSTVNSITGSYDSGTGVLTLTHAGTTLAAFEQALESVQYNNTSDTPSTLTRTISMVVRDTTNVSSAAATTTVTVASTNDAPVISGVDSALTYTESDPATVIDTTITVTDPDTTNCDQATINLSTNYQSTEDVLAYGGSVPGISAGAFNSGTGTLTLSGAATCADYATALESVTYENISLNPNTVLRTVEFQVRDASSLLGNVGATTITVAATSTPPTLSGVDDAAAFTENGGAVTIDSAVTISDPDSTNLNQATVSITGNFSSAEDVLVYATVNGITGSYNSGTGVLTLTHAGTTLANFEQALESVQYNNTSENPSTLTRTLSFVVRDTANVSSTADTTTVTIAAVNDNPVLSTVDNVANYTENGPAVTIDSTITVSDVDSTNLDQATVSIAGNFSSTEDSLVYSTVNGITGSYNSGTGVLTLTHAGTTLANFEQALESVQYQNSSENPSTLTRTISMVVRDSANASSAADTTTLTVTAVNDAPVISGVDNVANYTENAAAVIIDSGISISDVDNTQLNQAIVSITGNFSSSEDSLLYTDANGITGSYISGTGILTLSGTATLALYEQALESVEYQNSSDAPSTLVRTISMVVRDTGNTSSAADTTTLTVTAQNDDAVAADDNFSVTVNSTNNELDVLANDSDVDPGDTLTLTGFGTPTFGGSVVIGAPCSANTICYTPPADFTGVNVFTYEMQDSGLGNPQTGTVTISGTDTDGDGDIDFLDNCDNDPNPNQENNDSDSEGDVCDADDDNDGMDDTFETTYNGVNGCVLDPFDASDGTEDCDGDGLNNAGEAQAASDPTVDDVVPAFSGVQDITVDATGYLTAVNLGNIRAVDGADGEVVVNVDSVTGTTSQNDALNSRFRPGSTVITRSAQDSQGNAANSVQTINIQPLADFAPDQITVEGNTGVLARVFLNGEAPQYPVTVDYTVSGTSSGSDHTAASGTLTILAGVTGDISIDFNSDGMSEGNETLILTLSNPVNAELGSRRRHTITIAEGNVAPTVVLSVQQGANDGALITDDPVTVVVTANVTDTNPGDTVSFDWSGTPNPNLGTGTSASTTFEFDPSAEALGFHSIAVAVTDSAGATATAEVFLSLISAGDAPVFTPLADTDEDGIDDDNVLEGYGDVDRDGIPNYLDAYEDIEQGNLIQSQVGDSDPNVPEVQLENIKLIETEPGLQIRKGAVAVYGDAINGGTGGIMVSEDEIMEYADAGGISRAFANDVMVNIGGLFDFEISNMLPGATTRVVLPLSARILEGATYRKFSLRNGWRDFSTDGDNAIATTRSTNGVCPAPGHSSYRRGLNAFDNCVELTLVDGGPNDADGEANGVIRDPGGVAVIDPSPAPEQETPNDGSGGGVLHPFWLLMLTLWGALRAGRPRKKINNL